jgi:hypothetical protein
LSNDVKGAVSSQIQGEKLSGNSLAVVRHAFCIAESHTMKGGRYMLVQKSNASVSEPVLAGACTKGSVVEGRKSEVAAILDSLMQRWCKRGALRPIQGLLRAYPGPLWHAYHQMELLEALERLYGLELDQIKEEERRDLARVLHLLRRPSHLGRIDKEQLKTAGDTL